VLAIAATVLVGGAGGLFAPLDDLLLDWRFGWSARPSTGDVVVVEIDPKSLEAIGVWPWPRSVHARLIDALLDYDANEIAFDVDFSSRSTPEEDAALATALERAGGFVILATFKQPVLSEGGGLRESVNRPIEMLSRQAWPASVNVVTDPDGRVRTYPYAVELGGELVPSLPAVLAASRVKTERRFEIDFGIDVSGVDRMSVIDVIRGRIDRSRLEGKQVIVGAGAVELRDTFAVPRYGVLSGPDVQALATETLIQGRALVDLGAWPAALMSLLLSVYFVIDRRTLSAPALLGTAVVTGAAVMGGAIGLQSWLGLVLNTGGFHLAQLAVIFGLMGSELDLRDLTMRRTRRQYAATRAVLERVIADHFDAVVVVNQQREIVASSQPADELLGGGGGLVGKAIADSLPAVLLDPVEKALTAPDTVPAPAPAPVQTVLRGGAADGTDVVVDYVVTVSEIAADEDGKGEARSSWVACLTCRDVTARNAHERQIEYLANHDSLTGALSRTRMVAKIHDFFELWGGEQRAITVILMDLDRFKNINETLGHTVGDELLKQVARRLEDSGAYCVARLGADRFAVALPGVLDAAGQERLAFSIIREIARPFEIGDHRALVGVSLGIADSARSGTDPDALLAHADMALAEAKDAPGNSFFVFEPKLDERVQKTQALEVALREALERGEMNIVYQPQVDLATGDVVGAEALLRWRHPKIGEVPPDLFIPVAEDGGMIMDLGRWALRTACQDAARWPAPVRLAVNVSALQFEYGDIVTDIDAALDASALAPERLDIEVTESVFIHKTEAFIETLNAIGARGVQVALDDFGMGYSSLGYLSRLPVDKIKIDQSFVQGLPDDTESMAIVRSVLTLAETLNKKVIAEGIETADQAWLLRLAGCGVGQGYHFGRPQTQRQLCALLAREGPAFPVRAIA